jgi:hypothetical protein
MKKLLLLALFLVACGKDPAAEAKLRLYANAHGLRWRITRDQRNDFWCAQLQYPLGVRIYSVATKCQTTQMGAVKETIKEFENPPREEPWHEPEPKGEGPHD